MRKVILFLVIFLLLLAAPTAVRYLQYYDLNADERVPPPAYDPALIQVVPMPEGSDFVNEPALRDGFAENGLAAGVDKLAFYSTHSLQVGPVGKALITAGDNTWLSTTDRPGGLVLAATSQDGHVLTLGDIHFITQPYFTVYDNGRFIAQIAGFLAQYTGRCLTLSDFPTLTVALSE